MKFLAQGQVRSDPSGQVSWPFFKKVRNHTMAAVNVGSVWNIQDCLVVISVPIKCVPRNCYPGDLRSGQFRDLLMGKYEMLPVSHKPIKTTQFFQDHGPSPHLCRSGCNWRSGVTGRSPEVKWRRNPFFANKSRQDGIETRKWCKTTWLVEPLQGLCILTYLDHDLTLTLPDLRSNFQIDL